MDETTAAARRRATTGACAVLGVGVAALLVLQLVGRSTPTRAQQLHARAEAPTTTVAPSASTSSPTTEATDADSAGSDSAADAEDPPDAPETTVPSSATDFTDVVDQPEPAATSFATDEAVPPPPAATTTTTTTPPTTVATTTTTTVPPTTTTTAPSSAHTESGTASWWDSAPSTCAFRDAPKGTVLRVTNTATGNMTNCTVNTWGPAATDRVIDLSRDTFARIGDPTRGTMSVRVQW